MDIRVLVFNSGTFNRAELSKMSEQELWQLWEKDDDQAQVQMYYLDEFSCAFNDEEVSDQDWLYFVDYDNIKQSDEKPAMKVWVVAEHFCKNWGDDLSMVLGVRYTYEGAKALADERFHQVVTENPDWEIEEDGWMAESPQGFSHGHISIEIEDCEVK